MRLILILTDGIQKWWKEYDNKPLKREVWRFLEKRKTQ